MKKLTKTGEEFIKTICSGNGDSLIKGKYDYELPFTRTSSSVYEAKAKNNDGKVITTNEELGNALIEWYNQYAEESNLDANILAAQGYVESGYRLWHYSKIHSGVGLADLVGVRIYKKIVKTNQSDSEEAASSPFFSDDEIDKITKNMTDPELIRSYKYRNSSDTTVNSLNIAFDNRPILYQNIIDNPAISIKAQSIIMKEISARNKSLTANSLFAYNRNSKLVAETYQDLLNDAGKRFGDNFVKKGIDYVDFVFQCLADKNNSLIKKRFGKPRGIWFGYKLNLEVDEFEMFLG